MSPIEWYYAHGKEQVGPIPSAELKQLAAAGGLLPDDLVWREGMEQWVAARHVKGLFEAAPQPAEVPAKAAEPFAADVPPVSVVPATAPGLLSAHSAGHRRCPADERGQTALDRSRPHTARYPFDVVLDGVRAQFTPEFVDSTTRIFVGCGHYCLYAAMLANCGIALVLGIKTGLLDPVLQGVVWLLALAVLQYAAGRHCAALDRLNRTTPGSVATTVFLDSFALLNLVAGLAVVLGSAVLAVRSEAYWLILSGLLLFIVYEYLAFISLNPGTLGISVSSEAPADKEAIGLVSFLLKAIVRLSPVAFGAGVVCGTLRLFSACYLLFVPLEGRDAVAAFLGPEKLASLETAVEPNSAGKMLEVWPAQVTAAAATWWIIGFAALPFLAYVFFLLFHLLLEVIRAVLLIPGRPDTPAPGEQQQRGEP
jgi:hypothetical protein